MPSIHIQYKNYDDIIEVIYIAKNRYDTVDIRDLYDSWEGGTISFDFASEQQAMLFKLAHGGKYRPYG